MSVATRNVSRPTFGERVARLRAHCHGLPPLDARLESWMVEIINDHATALAKAIDLYGSPLNVISTEPLCHNISQLNRTAADRRLCFQVFFARKANKCLSFVDAAKRSGAGIDVASEQECEQALNRGVSSADIVCTAAIKTATLIARCVRSGVTMASDNADEFRQIREIASSLGTAATVALRVSGFEHRGEKLLSRFGFDIDEVAEFAEQAFDDDETDWVRVQGLHFHLDGYCADQRVSSIRQCLPLVDHLRSSGHDIRFLDIGGGLPMSYLQSAVQWNTFWEAHRESMMGQRPPITYRNHGLGLISVDGKLHGQRNVYPFCQSPVQEKWLADILDSDALEGGRIADSIRGRSLSLRCEPGRSVLDGCGFTVARVEFTKRHPSGDWFIGLGMNRTQCRTGSDDFLVDPLVVRSVRAGAWDFGQSIDGYLVGAYCTESELISLRKLRFPHGIRAGDLVVFPNTAGYFMHFLESRSHQFPLATNVVVDRTLPTLFRVDEIDSGGQ